MKSNFLLNKKFRASAVYQLAEWNQLNETEQESLTALNEEEEVYGIFRPSFVSSNITAKIAYREVALLFLHLQRSDMLPRYFTASGEKKLNDTIAQLVLDDILEIECNGDFVSGPAAVKEIFGDDISERSAIPDYLSNLSMEGIQYAFMLRNLDARSMANRLYTFNTLPYDASSKSHFNDSHSVKEFLIPYSNTELNFWLNKHWSFIDGAEKKGWLFWSNQEATTQFSNQQNNFIFKLYISPRLNDLQKVFKLSIPVLSSSHAFGFKTGSTLPQILRPDKMIAYFENMDSLNEAAGMLEKELAGYPAHGVPFTKQIDKKGLLSWGADPPQSDTVVFTPGESWRFKVTNELSLAIIQAQKDELDLQQAIHFIRARLSLAGINTNDWTPMKHFFQPSS